MLSIFYVLVFLEMWGVDEFIADLFKYFNLYGGGPQEFYGLMLIVGISKL